MSKDNEQQQKYLALTYLASLSRDPDLVELATGWVRTFDPFSDVLVVESEKCEEDFPRYFEPALVQTIRDAWQQLLAATTDEIEQEIENLKKKRIRDEQEAYKFNKPDAHFIDLEFWARAATWTDEQAAMLSLGRHPLPEYIDSITSLNDRQIQESRVAQDFWIAWLLQPPQGMPVRFPIVVAR